MNAPQQIISTTVTSPCTKLPKAFVCILNWNKGDETLSCLQSVFAQDYRNLRVVVVDNGSTDGSLAALRALGDRIDLITHSENQGFTGGCNAGMRHALAAGADYVWLLNNDTECDADTLSRLVAFAEAHPDIGMVSPIITDRGSGKDNYAVGTIDLATGHTQETADPIEAEALQRAYPHQIMLKGTALLLKRHLIDAIGYFDDRFFAYCEDNDYSMRRAAAGFRGACVTNARVYHDEGMPGQGWRKPYAFYYAARNGILFWRKHVPGLAGWKHSRWHSCTMFRVLARSGYGKAETEAFADGLWNGWRGVTGRWEPSRRSHHMPAPLRRIFVAMPALCLGLLEVNPRAVLRALRLRAP